MKFARPCSELLLKRLERPAGKVRMVLDTDTYNEVDDQFALAYALASPESMEVLAVYAAPFLNDRSKSPGDGMQKSYNEILRLLDKLHVSPDNFVFTGSDRYLADWEHPVESDAARDLIDKAMDSSVDEPLFVVAIGAITNVASAILLKPEIIDRIVVVWLGGHPLHWRHTREFNLMQDIMSARVIFDSGVPVVQIPCMGVASHMLATVPELEAYLYGKNEICNTLVDLFKEYEKDHFGWAKEIWDVSAIAYLVNPDWVPADIVHSPVLTDQCTWSFDSSRHFIKNGRIYKQDCGIQGYV
jgi:inosine-uridine nucleoside N-ribohydrolase